MKLLRIFTIAAAAALALAPRASADLTNSGVYALDGSGNQRTTFTNVETIALRQVVSNSVASDSMIQFAFTVYNPSGGAVFRHTGNSARATLGNSNSQLSGLAISRFYSVPGVYTFCGEASLAGVPTPPAQCAKFQISSPNINLIYPPNGARKLGDNPLTFRWVASGASNYKITVGEDAGFSRKKHDGTTSSAMYNYPASPSETEKLATDPAVYYWKVEGLDAGGARIAESIVYSFSLAAQAGSTSRNLAVLGLDWMDTGADFTQPQQFRVRVKNTGSSSEMDVRVKMTLSGQDAQQSPKAVENGLIAGETRELQFMAFMPPGQESGLAVACIEIFDDNNTDNCKTKTVTRSTGQGGAVEGTRETRKLTYQEMWDEVIKRLGPDAAKALEGYTFDTIDCPGCAEGELNELMLALMNGGAKLTSAQIADALQGFTASKTQTAVKAAAGPEEERELDVEMASPEKGKDQEWSGFTTAVKSETPFFYTVKARGAWRKTWELVSSEDAPAVDFDEKTVVGIVAGTGNKAESVRIISRRQVGDTTVFDYYMTEATGENPAVPYIFRTFEKVDGKTEFKRLDVGGK